MSMTDISQQSAARQQRHAVLFGDLARGVLEAEAAHLIRRRADEHHTCRRALFGKSRILGKEAVTGMDGLRTRTAGNFKNAFAAQITFCGRRSADANGFVRQLHMQERASASEYTATEWIPIFFRVRMMRQAIAPRLAIKTLSNISHLNRRSSCVYVMHPVVRTRWFNA